MEKKYLKIISKLDNMLLGILYGGQCFSQIAFTFYSYSFTLFELLPSIFPIRPRILPFT